MIAENKAQKISKKVIIGVILTILVMLMIFTMLFHKEETVNIANKRNFYAFNNYIESVFTNAEGTKILPIVYENTEDQITKADIESEFAKAGIEIKTISSNVITTGTIINTDKADYEVLIYGDTNCDGRVDILDARRIVQYIIDSEHYDFTGTNRVAANLENEKVDEINILDARKIITFILGSSNIIDTLPEPDTSEPTPDVPGPNVPGPGPGPSKPVVDPTPTITMLGPSEIKIKLNSEYEDPGATADYNATVTTTYYKKNDQGKEKVEKIDTTEEGTYIVEYTAVTAKGKEATPKQRIVKVIDVVTKVELELETDLQEKLKEQKEDAILNLEGVNVKLTKESSQENTISLLKLLEELPENCNLTVTSEAVELQNSDYIVKFDENIESNTNKEITLKLDYTNSYTDIEENNTISSNELQTAMSIIGKIRELKDETVETSPVVSEGEIYSEFVIANIKSGEHQEKIQYENDNGNITTEIKLNGEIVGKEKAELLIEVSETGVATIKLYAREAGQYKVTISSEKIQEPKIIEVTVTESQKANAVIITFPEQKNQTPENDSNITIREKGNPGTVKVEFIHEYIDKDTKKVEYTNSITNVTNNQVKIAVGEEKNSLETKKLDEANRELEDLEGDTIVKAIKLQALEGAVKSEEELATEDFTVTISINYEAETPIKMYAKYENTESEPVEIENIKIKVEQESIFKMAISDSTIIENGMTLYLDKEKANQSNDFIYVDGDTIYTLIPIIMKNQYEETMASILQSSDLSTQISETDKLAFVDKNNNGNYIKVAGFKGDGEVTQKTFQKVTDTSPIDFIGIALNENDKNTGNEDEELLKASPIKVCQGDATKVITEIKIKEIVKRPIETITMNVLKEKIYCYDNETAVLEIETGAKQEDISDYNKTMVQIEVSNKAKPVTSTSYITEVKDGKLLVKLDNATEPGQYEVKAKIIGKDTTEVTKEIQVEHNPIINRIEIKRSSNSNNNPIEATGKEEISLGEVKKGKNYIFDLTYYHDYYNKEGALQGSTEVSAPTEDKISIDDINIQELSDNIKLETNEYNALINRIRIPVSAEIEDKTIEFTLNITNIQDDKFTQKISVDVGNMIQVKDIKITPIPKSEGAPVDAKVKLYNKTGPIEDTGKEMVIQGDDSQYYTVFKLEIIDEENDSYPISNKLIHYNTIEGAQYGEGLTIIDQNNRENMKSKMTAAYVKVVPVLKEESTYKAITNQGEINNTEYIGITVTEEIKIDAIDIWYNGWYMGEAIEPTDKQSISRMYLVSSFDVDTSHIKQ